MEERSKRTTLVSNRLLVAEAGTKENGDTDGGGTGSADGREASAAETGSGKDKSSSEQTSKTLKRFVPSEKIRAEQGVDFPYDI
jgi:hypothetical protein